MELRICDGVPTLSETVALVTLLEALARKLDEEYRNGRRPVPPPDWMIRENKWRASRYGLEAEILLDDQGRTAPLRKEVEKLMEAHRPGASGSGPARAFSPLERMLEHGCSYERQRRILHRSGSMKAVTEALREELRTGRPVD